MQSRRIDLRVTVFRSLRWLGVERVTRVDHTRAIMLLKVFTQFLSK